jgi:hypothetical protein
MDDSHDSRRYGKRGFFRASSIIRAARSLAVEGVA